MIKETIVNITKTEYYSNKYLSLATYLGLRTKRAPQHINNFERSSQMSTNNDIKIDLSKKYMKH